MPITKKTISFGETAQLIKEAVGKRNEEIVASIYNELITPNSTPRDTGTLVFSWKANPTPTDYRPPKKKYDGWPEKYELGRYKRLWKKFYVYNNQPYLKKLNDSEKYQNFVEAAVTRAIRKVQGT